MKMSSQLKTLCLATIFVCFVCLVGNSQTTNATLSGIVEDAKGAVVPGGKVTITNPATGLRRTVTTNEDGAYTIPQLPPATYTVLAEATNFKRIQIPDIILNVNDQRSLRIRLEVGEVTSEVTVHPDDADTVRTDSAVATVIDRTTVQNMPLNGRSFSSLVLLTPGVTVSTYLSGTDFGQFSVNGQRPSTNAFTIDGVSANIGAPISVGGASSLALAGAYPGSSATGSTNNLVAIDALQEFKIQTSTYSAENGRQPGGQVQIVTRSGGNDFHGSVFDYVRNDALDARGYFNKKPAAKLPLRQNDFGGTFSGPLPLPHFGEGGPIFDSGKDRTFFFFSYEGQRLRLPTSGVGTVPSIRLRQEAFPALQPVLNAFPIPTGPETTSTTVCTPSPSDPTCAPNGRKYTGFAPYSYGFSNPSTLDATSIRIDHSISGHIVLFGRYNQSPSASISITLPIETEFAIRTRTLTLGATWTPGVQTSNEFRFNVSDVESTRALLLSTIGGAVPFDQNLLTNGNGGSGAISIVFSGNFATYTLGTGADSFQRQLNFVDNFSHIIGGHQLKFGVDLRRLTPTYGPQDTDTVSFNSEARIVSGQPSSYSINAVQASRPRFDNLSSYAQDTWKATKRLTLDIGLRWEFNPPPTEAEGRMPRVIFGVVGSDVSKATLAPAGTPFYKPIHTAFAPRFGASYQLSKKSGWESVIRGGIGKYYDLGNGTAASAWPFTVNRSTPNSFCPSTLTFPIPSGCSVRPQIGQQTTTGFSVNENLKLPYSLEWSLAVEQSIARHQTLSVSYVAALGRNLLVTENLNRTGFDPITGLATPRPNPNFGNIIYSVNGPTSNYQSLQVQYRTRFTRGLSSLVNYTWSHAIDEVSNDLLQAVLERGSADFDVRHNFSAAFHYDLPTLRLGSVVSRLLRGWAFDSIIHIQSGRPVNVNVNSSFVDATGAFYTPRPDLIQGVPLYIKDPSVPGGRRFNTAAFQRPPAVPGQAFYIPSRQGNLGRNVLRELPLEQVDASLARVFALRELLKLTLKGEVFNIFNHPMFGGYGLDATTQSTFGVPTRTLNTSLGGLSSLYQLGGPRSIQLSARISF